jgi:hypothetical protein
MKTQNQKLEAFLRGTGRTLTEAEALARFGIQNLRARMSEMRGVGLTVRKGITVTTGRAKYAVSARDVTGSRAKVFA